LAELLPLDDPEYPEPDFTYSSLTGERHDTGILPRHPGGFGPVQGIMSRAGVSSPNHQSPPSPLPSGGRTWLENGRGPSSPVLRREATAPA
jgi:hypothetical protein